MPKCFVPAAKDDETAEQVWSATKSFAEETTGWVVSDTRIYRLAYHQGGQEYLAEVGEPEPRTRELGTRGVVQGSPILVGKEEADSVEEFEPT